MVGENRMIELDLLVPTPDNPRQIREGDPGIQELAASIRAHGVLHPVIARPHPSLPGHFDLRAGARRLAAARLAGLTEIPVLVQDLTDEQALEITLIENLLRQDLSLLEEARGIQTCIEHGWDVRVIADHMGKSAAWVQRRARLLHLSETWRARIQDANDPVSMWPAANLELVARLDPEQQDAFLESHQRWCDRADLKTRELERVLTNLMHDLGKALWDLDDATLVPEAARCSVCPKRSSMRPSLFPEFELGGGAGDRCLDPACWQAKLEAEVERRREALGDKYGSVAVVSDGDDSYRRSRKGSRGAVPVLRADGEGAGTWFWGRRDQDSEAEEDQAEPEKADPSFRMWHAQNFAAAWAAFNICLGDIAMDWRHRRRWHCGLETLGMLAMEHYLDDVDHTIPGKSWDWLRVLIGITRVKGEFLNPVRAGIEECEAASLCVREQMRSETQAEGIVNHLQVLSAFAVHALIVREGCVPEIGNYAGIAAESEIMRFCAESFPISRLFLEDLPKLDLVGVAEDLGVEVERTWSVTRIIDTILDADLPEGTLTPELAQAFHMPKKPISLAEIKDEVRKRKKMRARKPALKKGGAGK